jgi:hypothetical protein
LGDGLVEEMQGRGLGCVLASTWGLVLLMLAWVPVPVLLLHTTDAAHTDQVLLLMPMPPAESWAWLGNTLAPCAAQQADCIMTIGRPLAPCYWPCCIATTTRHAGKSPRCAAPGL